MKNKDNFACRLSKSYIVALSLVALLTLFSQYLVQQALEKQETDGKVVNIAGRQRMLSQRIVKNVLILHISQENTEEVQKAFAELSSSLKLWKKSHKGLQQGDAELGLPPTTSDSIQKKFEELDSYYLAMVEASSKVIDIKKSDMRASIQTHLATLLQNEKNFLKKMNEIVEMYERVAKNKVNSLRVAEFTLMGITLLTLFLEALLIFRPAIKRINQYINEIIIYNEKLVASEEELRQNFEELQSTQDLLRSQNEILVSQSNQLLASEEELRQNLEELQAIQESLAKQKEELERKNIFQKAILDNSPITIITLNTHGYITSINQAVTQLVGYEPAELIGQYTPVQLHDRQEIEQELIRLNQEYGENLTELEEAFLYLARKHKVVRREWTFVRKDGSCLIADVYTCVMENQQGELIGYLKMAKDISEMKQAEERIKRLSLVASKTDSAVLIKDNDLKVVWVNEGFERLTGYTLKDLEGKDEGEVLYGAETNPTDVQRLKSSFDKQISFSFEIQEYKKTGETFWASLSGTPIFDEKGSLLQYVVIMQDITKRKQLEKIIQQNNEELKKSLVQVMQLRDESERARQEIQQQRDDILASIRYASRIQNAILPRVQQVLRYLEDFMIFYLPRDIISGDFYWFAKIEDEVFLAAGDCTGHGVPGALMTIIGNSLLEQIIKGDNILEPQMILTALDRRLLATLQQTQVVAGMKFSTETINDGMDIALVRFNPKTLQLCFAGAKRPLWIFDKSNPEPQVFKGDKYPIGSSQYKQKCFTQKEITLQKGATFYIFTDGYADQFSEYGKFTVRAFRNFLAEIYQKDFEEQKHYLKQNLLDWQGIEKQTDDILILGVRA